MSDKPPIQYTTLGIPLFSGYFEDLIGIPPVTETAYGEIYVADATTPQTIPDGQTYTQISAFSEADGHNGLSKNLVADKDNNQITIPSEFDGVYLVTFTLSAQADTLANLRVAVFVNDVEQDQIHGLNAVLQGADFTVAGSGLVETTEDSHIELRVAHDQASPISLTPSFINFSTHKVG